MRNRNALVKLCLTLIMSATCALAQEYATFSGRVVDPKQAPVADAKVTLTNLRRGSQQTITTDSTGTYLFDIVDPGDYSVMAKRENFADFRVDKISFQSRDRRTFKIELTIATTTTTVTVQAQAEGVSADSSGGAVLEHEYLEQVPINGRTIGALLQTAPGVLSGTGPGGGEINVNGLRSNTNYYQLDGVSLSGGEGVGAGGGGFRGPQGSGPGGFGGGNGTESISLDSLQEVRIQTSAFAPEFGRTPGAQVSMTSRGGSNQVHGSLYEYFRNHNLNANDWFANRGGLARGAMHQNQLGGNVGGKLISNKTFFFLNAELLWLAAPDTAVAAVPDLANRASAKANLRPYLNAFPIPNGPKLTGGAAQFTAVFTNPETRQSWGARIDHSINRRNNVFFRYSDSPSDSTSRASVFGAPNTISNQTSHSRSATGSLLTALGVGITNDLRANYTFNDFTNAGTMDNYGGAIPLTAAQLFPAKADVANSTYTLSILGVSSLTPFQHSHTKQTQFNFVDGLTINAGSHAYKMGVDVRKANNANFNATYGVNAVFSGLQGGNNSFLSGITATTTVSSSLPEIDPTTLNFSYYFQDTWRLAETTTLTYGLRWDVNPAPGTWQGARPLALSSNFPGQVTQSQSLYDTRWYDFAPRVGITHQLTGERGRELVFRGGWGWFRDLGYGTSLSAFSGAPYVNALSLTSENFPLSVSELTPPILPPTKPYNQVGAANRNLQSPRVTQWNVTFERNFGIGQVVSIGYVQTDGANLLRTTTQPSYSTTYNILRLATNGAASTYRGLQSQWRRRLSNNLLLQASYTYSHSIDTASNDAGFGGFATLFTSEKGNSDFDVRHNVNVSGSYQIPSGGKMPAFAAPAFKGWWTDFVFATRTGLPFDVTGLSSTSSNSTATSAAARGLFAQVRPNLLAGSVFVSDPTAPGGRRLNINVFGTPTGFQQGNLGRNALTGYGMYQLDMSLRREIMLGERRRLNLSAQAFNILNHPNFANPQPNEGANLASSNFGVSSRMLNQGVGGGSLGSVYRTGGPRSLQLVMRFQF